MPPQPEEAASTSDADEVTEAPAPTPEPTPDYRLKVGNYETTMAELESGDIDKDKPVTLIIAPSVEYRRVMEVLTRVSDLGYTVQFAAP